MDCLLLHTFLGDQFIPDSRLFRTLDCSCVRCAGNVCFWNFGMPLQWIPKLRKRDPLMKVRKIAKKYPKNRSSIFNDCLLLDCD